MAHNKLYRNFIILQEDERGYSQSNDKALSGYAKVEAKGDKCKISFYAQNLRQEDNYSMVLICCKKDLKQLIDIGPLAINEVGKGDTSKEYYVNNIASLGISYEKISGAAICRVKDNETEFTSVISKTKEEAEEVISIPTTKIKIKILDTTNVKEKQIRVSLYKRATKEPADQTYELVDLKDFVKGNLNSVEDKIYSLDNYSTILEFDNKKFENNGYELRFELYDGTRKITSIKKKFIVK